MSIPTARIYQPAKTAMQSGTAKTHHWILEFYPRTPDYIEPLMGWPGNRDTRQQLRLTFPTKEAAILYADRTGIAYIVQEPQNVRLKPKSYASNFQRPC